MQSRKNGNGFHHVIIQSNQTGNVKSGKKPWWSLISFPTWAADLPVSLLLVVAEAVVQLFYYIFSFRVSSLQVSPDKRVLPVDGPGTVRQPGAGGSGSALG